VNERATSTILVVEDDVSLRLAIRLNLEKRGWSVREAATVAAASAVFALSPPDLLLLDLNLPDGSGADFLHALRSRGECVVTVVMSAEPVSLLRLAETGPVWYLPKPFRIEALLDMLQLAATRRPVPPGSVTSASRETGILDLPVWARELRSACVTFSRTSARAVRSMSLSLRVASVPAELSPSRLATRIAAEYGLISWSELTDDVLRVRLSRDDGFRVGPRNGGDRRAADIPAITQSNSDIGATVVRPDGTPIDNLSEG
jgi:DNA-binding response OmpR family regulator